MSNSTVPNEKLPDRASPVGQESTSHQIIWPGVVIGFGTAVTMWILWYVMHLPSIRVAAPISASVLLLALIGAVCLGTRGLGRSAPHAGLIAGLAAALLILLLLGSMIFVAGSTPGDATATFIPSAPLIVAGFLSVCVGAGLIGGLMGRLLAPTRRRDQGFWLGRFACIAIATLVPLIVVGGAVTSAGAGMAVPDWPGTYGSNMFLYPIGLMADPYIFLEHTHRLFGTLVGLTAIVLTVAVLRAHGGWRSLLITLPLAGGAFAATIANNAGAIGPGISLPLLGLIAVSLLAWTLYANVRRSTGGPAAGIVALVCPQGMHGALRVHAINPIFGIFHGVLAQLIFGAMVMLAVSLTIGWRSTVSLPIDTTRAATASRGVAVATSACLLLQLTLAALYRHTGSQHALWAHVAFAIFVAILVGVLAFLLQRADDYSGPGRSMRRVGRILIVAIIFQFLMGFAAWGVAGEGGPDRVVATEDIGAVAGPAIDRTIIATVHQANGAFILAMTALGLGWAFRFGRPATAAKPTDAGNVRAAPALG